MSADADWSHLEKLLRTLPEGFRVESLGEVERMGARALSWRIILSTRLHEVVLIWLTHLEWVWVLTWTPWTALNSAYAGSFETAEEALAQAQTLLRAREAALRLQGVSSTLRVLPWS